MVVSRHWEERGMGSGCLVGAAFQFYKMKSIEDGCTTLWMYLTPLNYTLKNDYDDKCYVYVLFYNLKN